MEHFSYKGGCGVCVSRLLKEELAWVIDKRLWVISNKMLFKTILPLKKLKNKAILNIEKHCMCCYVILRNIF